MMDSQPLARLVFCVLCGLSLTEGGHDRDTLNISLEVPTWARAGGTAKLGCKYDVGGDPVYQVKWYKGNKEFYRFTPRESPPVKIFPFPGLQVDLTRSNATQLTLKRLDVSMKGSYSCEVSTDAPDFLTALKSSHLDVVVLPEGPPVITGLKESYSSDDLVWVNCTSYRSKPAANLTWSINSIQVEPGSLSSFKLKENSTETSRLKLRFTLGPGHFHHGRVTLQCTSRIHSYYQKSTEAFIYEEVKPQLSSVVDNTSPVSKDTSPVKNSGSTWTPSLIGVNTIFLSFCLTFRLLLSVLLIKS